MEESTRLIYDELPGLFENLKISYQRDQEGGQQEETEDEMTSTKCFGVILTRLDEILETFSVADKNYPKLLTMKASLLYEQAKIFLTNEDLIKSQELLEQALNLILDHRKHPQITFLYMRLVNHLSYLLSKTEAIQKARELLENLMGEEFSPDILVFSTEELFLNKVIDQSRAASKLNKLISNNLQMLGWICGKLGHHDLHAFRYHMALQQQMKATNFNPLQWAVRCVRLATLFMSNCKWTPARYHLSAAGTVLDRLELEMIDNSISAKAQAELARAWIHYGLHLFCISKEKLLEQYYAEQIESGDGDALIQNISSQILNLQIEEPLDQMLQFSELEVKIPAAPAHLICHTEHAHTLFLHTHAWLKRVRLHYTLRDYPLQYVNAVLDLSELYRYLVFYEPDVDSQYNVQKRRADALETLSTILREVRPQCYLAVSVELLKELAEVHVDLMSLNLRRLCLVTDYPENHKSLKRRDEAFTHIQSMLEKLMATVKEVRPSSKCTNPEIPSENDDSEINNIEVIATEKNPHVN